MHGEIQLLAVDAEIAQYQYFILFVSKYFDLSQKSFFLCNNKETSKLHRHYK
jgi:hypothetical protein